MKENIDIHIVMKNAFPNDYSSSSDSESYNNETEINKMVCLIRYS